MLGQSEALRKLQDRIRAAASSELSVLIIGETGSGKDLVANAIHQESKRSKNRFVALNTGAIPRELVTSELFGHVKGAFTGAIADRKGCFVEADGGTLFLDELATMDERAQVGLLRALEQRVIQPVGLNKDVPVNVRIVAATNCNLHNAVAAGTFREDLYYRLESFVITVPSLRQRPEDIPLLAAHFAEAIARENERTITGFTPAALQSLTSYPWPGNIRELKNAISQAVIMTRTGIIDLDHLPEKLALACPAPLIAQAPVIQPKAMPAEPPTAPPGSAQMTVSLTDGLDAIMKQIMQRAVNVCDGNVTRAAQLLRISRKTIYNNLGTGKDKTTFGSSAPSNVLIEPVAHPLAEQPAEAALSTNGGADIPVC